MDSRQQVLQELKLIFSGPNGDSFCLQTCHELIDSCNKNDEPCVEKQLAELYWYVLDQLNGMNWRDVPDESRDAFSAVSLLIYRSTKAKALASGKTDELYKILDIALLLGSCLKYDEIQFELSQLDDAARGVLPQPLPAAAAELFTPDFYDIVSRQPTRSGHIPTITCPSLESFYDDYLLADKPVVLKGCVEHWPAMAGDRSWKNLNYINKVAGHRFVPVELGSYLSDSSSQSIMKISEFLSRFIIDPGSSNEGHRPKSSKVSAGINAYECHPVGYIAQHKLLQQIPELRKDILIPDYCLLTTPIDEADSVDIPSAEPPVKKQKHEEAEQAEKFINQEYSESIPEDEEGDVRIQCWLGPLGTVSPLHHDPYHNLIAQVNGCKYIRLYAPSESRYLYELPGRMKNNSKVDFLNFNADAFPLASCASYTDIVLAEGDMLFIPRHHWHWIAAIDKYTAKQFQDDVTKNNHLKQDSTARATAFSAESSDGERRACGAGPEHQDASVSVHNSNLDHNDNSSKPSNGSHAEASIAEGAEFLYSKGSVGDHDSSSKNFSFSVNFWWGRRILKDDIN